LNIFCTNYCSNDQIKEDKIKVAYTKFYFKSLRSTSHLQDIDLDLDGKTMKGYHPILAKRGEGKESD